MISFSTQESLAIFASAMTRKKKQENNVIVWLRNIKPRHYVLTVLLLIVTLFQFVHGWGEFYARHLYPLIAGPLSWLTAKVPFCLSDCFYLLAITVLTGYFITGFFIRKKKKLHTLGVLLESALWLHVWFYLAWGLNYWQRDFYQRTGIPRAEFSEKAFQAFVDDYVERLNNSYIAFDSISCTEVRDKVVHSYNQIYNNLGIHRPFNQDPQVKTMLITPLASMVGVTGSMGPFFSEFTLNGDVLPQDYPHTYAHELSHLMGITTEAEANFYAYQACINATDKRIRFSGYLSIYTHVVNNVHALLGEAAYARFIKRVRPEIKQLVLAHSQYWQSKYNPTIGHIQDRLYDLYLRSHHVSEGRKNYSQVIGLLISYQNK